MTRYLSSSLIGLLTVSCLNLWLAIVIASDAMFGGQTQTDMLEWNPGLPMPAERTNAEKPIDAYNQILVRPLFYKNREPFVPPPAPQPVSNINAPAAISDPGFVLAGVLITGETRKAYILTRANNSGTWAREGDDYMGWKIRSIKETGIRFEQSGRVIDVQLYPPN